MVADTFDPPRLQLGIRQAGIDRELPPNLLTGGSIAGLMRFQNRDLVDARNQLGQLAAAVADQLNRQQALGLDLNQAAPAARCCGSQPPQVLASRFNSGCGDDRRQRGRQLAGARQRLRAHRATAPAAIRCGGCRDNHLFGPPELATITPAALAAGVQVDGITVQLDGNAEPAVGDRFLLQPVGGRGTRYRAGARRPARHRRGRAGERVGRRSTMPARLTIDRLKVLSPIASAPVRGAAALRASIR